MKILLVDDHEVVRLGTKALLSRYPQFQVVAEAETAQEGVKQALAHRPDVVIMDVRLPGMSGIEATREITAQLPETKVIMLTSFAEDKLLFDSIVAGAVGYVLKQIGSGELVRALETVARGEALLDPAVTKKVFDRVREDARKSEGESFSRLSDRELQVLALVAQGSTNREISEKVFLSEKTVRNYVSAILSKLKLSTRAEAAAYAVRHHVEDHLPTQ
ncbi:MAG TPA: response regulator transcription factor [Anaerolineales bacterium]|nr:response regulator transcription factor [Anaerolineales bacterium]